MFICLSISEHLDCFYLLKMLVAQSSSTLCDPMDHSPPGSSVHGIPLGKNTGVGCPSLLQGIFSTQGPNLSLLHCRQILYCLNPQGSSEYLPFWCYEWCCCEAACKSMNISFPVPAFNSGIDTEVALFNYMVILYLILLGTAVLFSTVAVPFYIPASNAQAFWNLYMLSKIWSFLSFFFF